MGTGTELLDGREVAWPARREFRDALRDVPTRPVRDSYGENMTLSAH